MSFVYILWHKLKKTEFEPKGFREKKEVSKIDKTLKSCCGK